MKVAIHQPQYIPWIPYFSKIAQVDVFVLLEDVQYQKNGLQNRNNILSWNGQVLLTVPVNCRLGEKINEVTIAKPSALGKHLKTIEQNYKKAPYFDAVMAAICSSLLDHYENLADLNNALIKRILFYLQIDTQVISSCELEKEGDKSDLVLSICKTLGATTYVTGEGALSYMKLEDFAANEISIERLQYRFASYNQIHSRDTFVEKLSILDLLMNLGPEARNFL